MKFATPRREREWLRTRWKQRQWPNASFSSCPNFCLEKTVVLRITAEEKTEKEHARKHRKRNTLRPLIYALGHERLKEGPQDEHCRRNGEKICRTLKASPTRSISINTLTRPPHEASTHKEKATAGLTWMVTLGVTVSGVWSSSSETFLLAHHDLAMRSLNWHNGERGKKVAG